MTLGLACVLITPIGAFAASQKLRVVAHASAVGYPATATAAATVQRPLAIYARVLSEPKQAVTITWRTRCLKGGKATVKIGSWRGTSGKLLRLALPVVKPGSCRTTVLSGASRMLQLQILAI